MHVPAAKSEIDQYAGNGDAGRRRPAAEPPRRDRDREPAIGPDVAVGLGADRAVEVRQLFVIEAQRYFAGGMQATQRREKLLRGFFRYRGAVRHAHALPFKRSMTAATP